MSRQTVRKLFLIVVLCVLGSSGYAAYHHMGEIDSGIFVGTYPETADTKLDSCTLCHTGGSYVNPKDGKTVTLGSCQWCHYSYGYDASGNIDATLNAYGLAYKSKGRSSAALGAIEDTDSDGDGYANKIEIAALRFPGDKNDDPSKVPAPFKVYSREQLECLPQHTQFLLMNAHKSTDFYAEYVGVAMADLLKSAGILPSALNIKVFAPDGFSQFHPLDPDQNPLFYHVIGDYPPAVYHYSDQADVQKNQTDGWVDYTSPFGIGFKNGDSIENEDGLKLMLAFYRDAEYLDPGVLTPQNKLDGEGPFRVVPPQKVPGPPDQRSTAGNQSVIWPFDANADHNAGYSTRSATIIKVDPLPEGTTDIDTLEAGWKYVDEGKIVVYGAIDPIPTIVEKLEVLWATLKSSDPKSYKNPIYRKIFQLEVALVKQLVKYGKYSAALKVLEKGVMVHVDGCSAETGRSDGSDWLRDCTLQKKIYWDLHELVVLLGIRA